MKLNFVMINGLKYLKVAWVQNHEKLSIVIAKSLLRQMYFGH